MAASLELGREQVLAYRRRVGGLDVRSPMGPEALRRAAWAGLQDSMPRAALLSLHARLDDVHPLSWDDPALVQLWGPRYSTYVVPEQDFAVFSLGRLPDDEKGRRRAERMAELLRPYVEGGRMPDADVGRALDVNPSLFRYAGATGTVRIRWEGARAPAIWTVPAPDIDPADARDELARRHLHVFGPTTEEGFARWAGVSRRAAAAAYASLAAGLLPVRTPLGDEWLLAADEEAARGAPVAPAAARLLPSGDAYFLLDGAERELLVRDAGRRALLWTPRVWPGALLVDGEIRGVWRRAGHVVRADAWEPLTAAQRAAVEHEARSLPLPGLDREVEIAWA